MCYLITRQRYIHPPVPHADKVVYHSVFQDISLYILPEIPVRIEMDSRENPIGFLRVLPGDNGREF